MFKAEAQEGFLKGFKNVEPGTYLDSNGVERAYDGYYRITLLVFNENGELIDVFCRIPKTPDGESMYVQLRNMNLMTKLLVDVEIHFTENGKNVRCFLVNFVPVN